MVHTRKKAQKNRSGTANEYKALSQKRLIGWFSEDGGWLDGIYGPPGAGAT